MVATHCFSAVILHAEELLAFGPGPSPANRPDTDVLVTGNIGSQTCLIKTPGGARKPR